MTEQDRATTSTEASSDRSGTIARRALLGTVGIAGLGGIVAAVLGGTGRGDTGPRPFAQATQYPIVQGPGTPAVARTPFVPTASPDMDDMAHSAVQKFPAKTAGAGLQPLKPTIVAGVKVFDLKVGTTNWEVTPGNFLKSFAYNDQVPGPIISVIEGDRVRLRLRNDLQETTSLHCHGVKVRNQMDGVPFITQVPIEPGQTYEYEFTAAPMGTHMYHSHHNATEQVGKGMLGPLVILPKEAKTDPRYDREEFFLLNDQLGGFTINGKGFPATVPFTAKLGERIRFRFMNAGLQAHPIHLHGLTYEVFARDGYPLAQPYKCDTITVQPGERYDAIVEADAAGAWAFHCHVLSHAEAKTGMFGMVTALIVS